MGLGSGRKPLAHDSLAARWLFSGLDVGGSGQPVNQLLADFVKQGLPRFDGEKLVVAAPRRPVASARR